MRFMRTPVLKPRIQSTAMVSRMKSKNALHLLLMFVAAGLPPSDSELGPPESTSLRVWGRDVWEIPVDSTGIKMLDNALAEFRASIALTWQR